MPEPITLAVPGRFNSPDAELKFSLLANSQNKAVVASDFSSDSLYAISHLAKGCDTVILNCKGQDIDRDSVLSTLVALNREGKKVVLVDPSEGLKRRMESTKMASIIEIRADLKEALNEFIPNARPDPSARSIRHQLEGELTVSSDLEKRDFRNGGLGTFTPLPEISAQGFALNDRTAVLRISSADGNLYEDTEFQNRLRATFPIIDAIKPANLAEVIVDLSGIEQLRGSSATALLELSNHVKEPNKGHQAVKVTLTGISEKVAQTLSRLGLDRMFEVIPDRDEAFKRAQERTSAN